MNYSLSISFRFIAWARLAEPSDMLVPGRTLTCPSLSMIFKSPFGKVSTGNSGFVGREGVGSSIFLPIFSTKRRTKAIGGVINTACHHGITRKRSAPRSRVLSQGIKAMAPPVIHAASCPSVPHFKTSSARILDPTERKMTWMNVKVIPIATFISSRFREIPTHCKL